MMSARDVPGDDRRRRRGATTLLLVVTALLVLSITAALFFATPPWLPVFFLGIWVVVAGLWTAVRLTSRG